jgi:hypothetical protein
MLAKRDRLFFPFNPFGKVSLLYLKLMRFPAHMVMGSRLKSGKIYNLRLTRNAALKVNRESE